MIPVIDPSKISDKASELQDRIESDGFDSFLASEKAFYCIQLLTNEVNSGGADRYYRYDGANYAEETVTSLRLVGQIQLADNLETANKMFPTSTLSSIDEREEFLSRMSEADKQNLESLFVPVFSYSPYQDLWRLLHSL